MSNNKSHSQPTKGLGDCCASNNTNGECGLPLWVNANYLTRSNISYEARPPAQGEPENADEAILASGSRPLLTVGEVAAFLRVSEKTVRRIIKTGNLAVIRIGRSIRINPEVIEKIMRQDE